jgi:hypothetical protein
VDARRIDPNTDTMKNIQRRGDKGMSEQDRQDTATRHLPDFQSREELAEFWDTHSFTDYLDDLEPVKMQVTEEVAAPLDKVTQVRFDEATDQQLADYAKKRGIRKGTLLRMIALDWLRNQKRHAS